jgi:hypothetical protein
MSGWRPQKVDCTDGLAAGDIAVVMVYLFGHMNDLACCIADVGERRNRPHVASHRLTVRSLASMGQKC